MRSRAVETIDMLTTGKGIPSPQFDGIEIEKNSYLPFCANIIVKYKNVVGGLHTLGLLSEFFVLEKEDEEPIREIYRIELGKIQFD